MNWMELIDDHQFYLVRLCPELWLEIDHGAFRTLELLRPSQTERLPAFQLGDVLLLYHPQPPIPDAPPAELSHVVAIRAELSNATGYRLGPVIRLLPSLDRERMLNACQRLSLPALFQRVDDPTFVLQRLTSGQQEEFLQYVMDTGVSLSIEKERADSAVVGAIGDTPGIIEFDW